MAKSLVRVHVESTDRDTTVSQAFAEVAGLTVLEEAAVDALGRPLKATRHGGRPIKPRTSVDEEAAKKDPARKAAAKSDGPAVDNQEEKS